MTAELKNIQSICADCGRPVPARYLQRDEAVYLEKTCSEHGISFILASEEADTFERWLSFQSINVPPRVTITKGVCKEFSDTRPDSMNQDAAERIAQENTLNTECPLHCGVCENHLMTACCVLLNLTNRCNQHCTYCFADADATDEEDPSLAEIEHWLDRLIELGEERKFNIQLSGGEPTVREDLEDIVRLCKEKGFEYIQLNTNGRKLAEDAAYARRLKAAGLTTVFLQFDGVDDDVYKQLRGEPLLQVKKEAIKNCGAAALPVTLVPTILKNVNLSQVGGIIDFMLDHVSTVKGVHFQPASFFGRTPDERNADGDYDERVTMFSVMNEIEKQTDGCIQKSALAPISTGHPLCCFCATFMKEKDGKVGALSGGGSCCEPDDPLEIIRRDRDFVLNKWEVNEPDENCCCEREEEICDETENEACCEPDEKACCVSDQDDGTMSFDEAIAMFRNNMFTISGMAFMDETNLDAERLRRCRVQVFTPDERLVPFCGYYAGYKK